MVAFIGYLGVVFAVLFAVFLGMVYNLWAWTLVAHWYLSTYLVKYFSWATNISPAAISVVILGIAIVNMYVSGAKFFQETPEENKTKVIVEKILYNLIAPWFMMLCVYLLGSWFNLG